jgi:hypothetical protein
MELSTNLETNLIRNQPHSEVIPLPKSRCQIICKYQSQLVSVLTFADLARFQAHNTEVLDDAVLGNFVLWVVAIEPALPYVAADATQGVSILFFYFCFQLHMLTRYRYGSLPYVYKCNG